VLLGDRLGEAIIIIIKFIGLKTQHHKKTFITENKTGVARLRKLLWLPEIHAVIE